MEKEKTTQSESKSEATEMTQNKEGKNETTEDPTKKNDDKLTKNLDTKTQEVNVDGTSPMSEPCKEVSESSNEDNKNLLNPQRLPGDGEHQLKEGSQKTAEEEAIEEDDGMYKNFLYSSVLRGFLYIVIGNNLTLVKKKIHCYTC